MAQIVVIEDDSIMLLNLIEVLEYENYAPVGARSGGEGLKLIESNPPDLILCDVMLPDTDGFEMARTLRARSATAHIPLIFISAHAERADHEQGSETNVVNYVMKPFDVSELLEIIRSTLDGDSHDAGQQV